MCRDTKKMRSLLKQIPVPMVGLLNDAAHDCFKLYLDVSCCMQGKYYIQPCSVLLTEACRNSSHSNKDLELRWFGFSNFFVETHCKSVVDQLKLQLGQLEYLGHIFDRILLILDNYKRRLLQFMLDDGQIIPSMFLLVYIFQLIPPHLDEPILSVILHII